MFMGTFIGKADDFRDDYDDHQLMARPGVSLEEQNCV